ncbi:MAG: methyl-accepting chemotaxis protein [Oscillospiraceae bacterium]
MSKISKKILIVVGALILSMALIILFTSITMSKLHNDSIMSERATAGINVLKNDIGVQVTRLAEITEQQAMYAAAESAAAGTVGSDIDAVWNKAKGTDKDYAAVLDASGKVVWKSENCSLSDSDLSQILSGISKDGVVRHEETLCIEHLTSIQSGGSIIIGMNLDETSFLDDVKKQTGAEVTIFQGNTRYATTVVNEAGDRVVGTTMSAEVEKCVINEHENYMGTADILGQKHYVNYEPLYDINNFQVGAYFSGFSSAESDAMFGTILLVSIGITVVVIVIAAVLLFLLLRNMVEKPIIEANNIAELMSRGELSAPDTNFKFGNDEIGDFARRLEGTKHDLSSCITDISNVLSQMAAGDFSSSSSMEYIGDFAKINESFKSIEKNLHNVISGINASADDVSAGAAQMADGTQCLAEGTTKQATAIDELSATIADISEHINKNAENAKQANRFSEQTEEKIELQDKDISDMLSAMEVIKNESNQISNIIKTIEDIAFQTNILALNAAIEAARAGEAGKGFAVVADEVRNLAAKSAEAANNTNSLISSTIAAVNNGAEIAQRTADSMLAVKDFAQQTNTLLSEISDASESQAEAVKQVTIGLEQIASVVQQNSATAEQSAASCEELSSMAGTLKQQIGQLRA